MQFKFSQYIIMDIAIYKKFHLRKSFKDFLNKNSFFGLQKCSITKKRVIKQFWHYVVKL
jgi:hypothetical protein